MEVLRDTGNNEHRCITRDQLGLYGSIVTFATYTAATSKSNAIPRDDILKALKVCVVQHAALRTIVQAEGTGLPRLAAIRNLGLDHHLRMLDSAAGDAQSTEKILQIIHNDPLAASHERPQWRVYIVPQLVQSRSLQLTFLVAFASSHNLMDGQSGMIFHETFCKALVSEDKAQFDASAEWTIPEDAPPLPPALETAGNLKISWSFLVAPLLIEYFPKWLLNLLGMQQASRHHIWRGSATRPLLPDAKTPVTTAVRLGFMSSSAVKSLLAICRQHESRLTSLLNFVFARVLANTLLSRGDTYKQFKCETAISLRRALGRDLEQSMANYVSAVDEILNVQLSQPADLATMTSEDWAAVRASTQKLSEAASTLSDQPIGLLKYLSDYRQWTLKRASAPAEASFAMSNLGVLDNRPSSGGSTIADFGFSQSADATGAAIGLNIASARGGRLTIVLSWWPGMLGVSDEDRFVEEVCNDFVKAMESFANSTM